MAAFRTGAPPTARVERDGVQVVLTLQPSGSGARYSDGRITFWEHHGEARWEQAGQAITCRGDR